MIHCMDGAVAIARQWRETGGVRRRMGRARADLGCVSRLREKLSAPMCIGTYGLQLSAFSLPK